MSSLVIRRNARISTPRNTEALNPVRSYAATQQLAATAPVQAQTGRPRFLTALLRALAGSAA